jgi:hypothetical protein
VNDKPQNAANNPLKRRMRNPIKKTSEITFEEITDDEKIKTSGTNDD